jgi:hypothetical protein
VYHDILSFLIHFPSLLPTHRRCPSQDRHSASRRGFTLHVAYRKVGFSDQRLRKNLEKVLYTSWTLTIGGVCRLYGQHSRFASPWCMTYGRRSDADGCCSASSVSPRNLFAAPLPGAAVLPPRSVAASSLRTAAGATDAVRARRANSEREANGSNRERRDRVTAPLGRAAIPLPSSPPQRCSARPRRPPGPVRAQTARYHSKWPMRVGTWNINSVRRRLPLVLDWLAANQPDVLCLQETKVQDNEVSCFRFPRCWLLFSLPRHEGV